MLLDLLYQHQLSDICFKLTKIIKIHEKRLHLKVSHTFLILIFKTAVKGTHMKTQSHTFGFSVVPPQQTFLMMLIPTLIYR